MPYGKMLGEPESLTELDLTKLYTPRQACRFIPSSQGTGCLTMETFNAWRKAGKFKATKIGKGWFVSGAELARLVQLDTFTLPADFVSPTKRKREVDQAMKDLEAMGLFKPKRKVKRRPRT